MRILFINSVCGYGSTGRICAELAKEYEAQGWECRIAFGRDGKVPEDCKRYAVRIGSDFGVRFHVLWTRLTDRHGLASRLATQQFLKWAEDYHPDVLWLHNIHGYYLHYGLLFRWIKSHPEMEVKWTLHDCWAFTGHCFHFTCAGCDRWKTGCYACPQKKRYPASLLFDASAFNYRFKKETFTGVRRLTVITPSQWLADLVSQSFLGEYPVEVIHNRINTEVFRPVKGNIRTRLGLDDQRILLGVSNVWEESKGLKDFLWLFPRLPDNWRIVLVGLNTAQLRELPSGIVGLPRTESQAELAELYSAADLFWNPAREETFGMTTVEALACGTMAVVYRGSASEEIANEYGGITIDPDPRDLLPILQTFASSNEETI